MGKRKKKTVPQKAKAKDSEAESPEKVKPVIREDDEELPAFGILPNRDLKKNLGCG
ncbi:hypothetical protein [Chryseotalea sanaruensis]|nr:hypothetical protein [Chryseotalea sanaruensis]